MLEHTIVQNLEGIVQQVKNNYHYFSVFNPLPPVIILSFRLLRNFYHLVFWNQEFEIHKRNIKVNSNVVWHY